MAGVMCYDDGKGKKKKDLCDHKLPHLHPLAAL